MDKNEENLKKQLRPIIAESFEIEEEVEGEFLIDGTRVVIDFLLYPKPDIIARGFDAAWWGLEVKSPYGKDPKKKGLQVAWQAVTYSQSVFQNRRPLFVAIFPHIHEFFPHIKVLRSDGKGTYEANEGHWLKCFLQKANVGSFEVLSKGAGWKIEFGAGARYYSTAKGRSKIINIGTRRVVGSWK